MALETCTCDPIPCTSSRESEPGAVLRDYVEAGVGRWHVVVTDLGGPNETIYKQVLVSEEPGNSDPIPDYFELSSDGAADFDGVPAKDADNTATHTVTCEKKEGDTDNVDTSYSGTARILITAGLTLSANDFNFASGVASITVGPIDKICDFRLSAVDTSDVIKRSDIDLRFK